MDSRTIRQIYQDRYAGEKLVKVVGEAPYVFCPIGWEQLLHTYKACVVWSKTSLGNITLKSVVSQLTAPESESSSPRRSTTSAKEPPLSVCVSAFPVYIYPFANGLRQKTWTWRLDMRSMKAFPWSKGVKDFVRIGKPSGNLNCSWSTMVEVIYVLQISVKITSTLATYSVTINLRLFLGA